MLLSSVNSFTSSPSFIAPSPLPPLEQRPPFAQPSSPPIEEESRSSKRVIKQSCAAEEIAEALRLKGELWIHGSYGSGKSRAIDKYVKAHQQDYAVYEHFSPKSKEIEEELFLFWIEVLNKLDPKCKHETPENPLERLVSLLQEKSSLFVFENLEVKHLAYLDVFFTKMKGEAHHTIVSSEKQLEICSHMVIFDDLAKEELIKDSQLSFDMQKELKIRFLDDYSFSFAAKILGVIFLEERLAFSKEEENPLCSLLKLLSKKDALLFEMIEKLSFLSATPIPQAFLDHLFSKGSDVAAKKKLVNLFSLPSQTSLQLHPQLIKTLEEGNITSKEKKEKICLELVKALRSYLPSTFVEEEYGWSCLAIEQLNFLSNSQFSLPAKKALLFPMSSLLFSVGYYYSQQGQPVKAMHISIDARKRVEAGIHLGKPAKIKFTQSDELHLCLEKLYEISPHLPYLYAQLQYQIGRCYFYHKDSDYKSGSLAVLEHGKRVAEWLIKKGVTGEVPLVSILIERNGLLYHKREERAYKEVIEGYRSLIESKKQCYDIDFQKEEKTAPISLDKDTVHLTTCLDYLVQAATDAQSPSSIENKADTLAKIAQTARSQILLGNYFLSIPNFSKALQHFATAKALNTSPNYLLEAHKGEFKLYTLQTDFVKAAKSAEAYTLLAEDYYPSYSLLRSLLRPFCTSREIEVLGDGIFSWIETIERGNQLKETKEQALFVKILQGALPTKEKLHKLKEITEQRESARHTQTLPTGKVEVKEIKEEKGVTLKTPHHTLSMTERFANYLQEKGEWHALIRELERGRGLNENSRFFISEGYRIKFDPQEEQTPPDAAQEERSEEPIGGREHLSDDEEELSDLAKEKESYKEKTDALHMPQIALSEEVEIRRKKIVTLEEEATKKKLKKHREEIERAITTHTAQEEEEITAFITREAERYETSPHPVKEFAYSYVAQQKRTQLKKATQKEQLQLEKLQSEREYLHQRLAYLERKERILRERELQKCQNLGQDLGKNLAKSSGKGLQQEMKKALSKSANSLISKEARPLILEGESISLQKERASQMHFSDPITFAYHTIKHGKSCFDEEGKFSTQQFERAATDYLSKSRFLVSRDATRVCVIPDQHDPLLTNYRYIRFYLEPHQFSSILHLQKQISLLEERIEKIQRIIANDEYGKKQHEKKRDKELNEEKKRLEKEKKELEEFAQSQTCDFAVLGGAAQADQSSYSLSFKTRFSKTFNIRNIPDPLRVGVPYEIPKEATPQ